MFTSDIFFSLSSILAILTSVIVLSTLVFLVLIRRELFDPRVYVLYGMFHWVIISQLGTVLGLDKILGFEFFAIEFSEATHIKACLSILVAVISFLLGYSIAPFRLTFKPACSIVSQCRVDFNKLIRLTLILAIIGVSAQYIAIKRMLDISPFLLAPVAYLVIPASVLSIYLLAVYTRGLKSIKRWVSMVVLGGVVFFTISVTNFAVIFPLFSLLYWYFNRGAPVQRAPFKVILLLCIMYPIAMFMNVFVKIFQRPDGIGASLSLERLIAPETFTEVIFRVATLDVFNPEDYSVILFAIETYADQWNLLLGKSLLVFLPILKFIWPEVRGLGRILVLDYYGPSYENVNVGWAVPPVGELIANFWYLSVPFAYLLLGIICRYMYKLFLQCKSQAYLAFYGVCLPGLFLQQRGDFLNANVYSIYIVIVILIVFRLSSRRAKTLCANVSETLPPNNLE
ncbi:MAG: hypothetical protein AB1401_14505 [Thermodesulfobacteriota bacterium]